MKKEAIIKNKKKILIASAAMMMLLLTAFVFFIFRYRFYIVYGIYDTLRPAEKDILSEYDGELCEIELCAYEKTNSMMLVNSEFMIDVNDNITLAAVQGEHYVDVSALLYLEELFASCEKETGESLFITSSYRSYEKQAEVYASNEFAVAPGASEHQCGLSVDVRTKDNASLYFIRSKAGRWLASHAHEYGFIIRYPFYAQDETGVTYEPWHIRYVDAPHAEIIYRTKCSLEEYSSLFEKGTVYTYGGFALLYTDEGAERASFPSSARDILVSEDNTGGVFVWGRID